MDERHQLAELIRQAHNVLHQQLGNHHMIVNGIEMGPVRVAIPNGNGILRQYHINASSVRLDYFFRHDLVGIYDQVRGQFANGHNHDFGLNINGNGANLGQTRSIFTYLEGGANQVHQNGPAIADQCVHHMLVLLQHLEPHLLEQYRIPIHFPQN
jgi:hypothetical protein